MVARKPSFQWRVTAERHEPVGGSAFSLFQTEARMPTKMEVTLKDRRIKDCCSEVPRTF